MNLDSEKVKSAYAALGNEAAVARMFGVSRQRMNQIRKKFNIKYKKKNSRDSRNLDIVYSISHGKSFSHVAKEYSLSEAYVKNLYYRKRGKLC